jgi:hypothetical protein
MCASAAMTGPTKLIIVCCHGIWTPSCTAGTEVEAEAEANWLIAPFQTGETGTFVEHIRTALRLLAQDQQAVVMFSGYVYSRA